MAVLLFAVVGVLCGWLWHEIWAPAPVGFAYQGQARFEDDVVFRGVGLCLLIGVAAGVVLGAAVTWAFEADEVITLVGLVVGALAAGWLMAWVGAALGPAPAQEAAKGAEDFAEVRGNLDAGRLVPWVAFPGGALLGSVLVLVGSTGRHRHTPDPTSYDAQEQVSA